MLKMKVLAGLVAVAGLAFMAASPSQAMDIAKVKAKDTPEVGSLQSVQVCAASFTASAYLATKGSEEADLYLKLAKAWGQVAAQMSNMTYSDYIDKALTPDMQALYDSGTDVVQFYHVYCLKATQDMMNKDSSK
jgi:hypothetical protein